MSSEAGPSNAPPSVPSEASPSTAVPDTTPEAAPPIPPPTLKRGRGRPRKDGLPPGSAPNSRTRARVTAAAASPAEGPQTPPPQRRGRGRPRTVRAAPEPEIEEEEEQEPKDGNDEGDDTIHVAQPSPSPDEGSHGDDEAQDAIHDAQTSQPSKELPDQSEVDAEEQRKAYELREFEHGKILYWRERNREVYPWLEEEKKRLKEEQRKKEPEETLRENMKQIEMKLQAKLANCRAFGCNIEGCEARHERPLEDILHDLDDLHARVEKHHRHLDSLLTPGKRRKSVDDAWGFVPVAPKRMRLVKKEDGEEIVWENGMGQKDVLKVMMFKEENPGMSIFGTNEQRHAPWAFRMEDMIFRHKQ
jgi:hypothetical protein